MCNGPSLLAVDFDHITESGVFTFGLNKINLLFERTEHRPKAVVSINPFVIQQNLIFFNETSIPLFLSYRAKSYGIQTRSNVHYLHCSNLRGIFARDVSFSVWDGHTVTFVALQIAFHMGFQDVALVGCDHSFAAKGPPNQTVTAGSQDPDHFDPKYFADGMKWQLPDLVESEFAYQKALQAFAESGRRLVNCTAGGKLELLPRHDLARFLDD